MPSLSCIANVFREPHAMPGWLEMAKSGFFDDAVVISSPPANVPPDEETIELVRKAGVRLVFTSIEEGYGVVRTRCIRECRTDFLMILDADERFVPKLPLMRCEGTEAYPQVKEPNLRVIIEQPVFDQGSLLKKMLAAADVAKADAIRLSRRHWFGAPGDYSKPCQNWQNIADWQLRLLRNSPFLFYDPQRKMHEILRDSRTWGSPNYISGDTREGPFLSEHHHFWAKSADPEGRKLALETYTRLDASSVVSMWSKVGFGDKEDGK